MGTVSRPSARRGRCNDKRFAAFGRGFRRAGALLLVAALLNLAGPAAAAPAPAGQVTAGEGLTLDGAPAVAGQTFFSGSVVAPPEGSRSALDLGNLARSELSGGAALKLDFSQTSVSGALVAGGARLSVPRGVASSVETADASVVSDDGGPALFSVRVAPEGTTLAVQSGRVEMRAAGGSRTALAGQTLYSSRGSAPAPPQARHNLSGEQRAGLLVGIAAAIAVVVVILAGRGDDVEQPGDCPVIILSGTTDIPPC